VTYRRTGLLAVPARRGLPRSEYSSLTITPGCWRTFVRFSVKPSISLGEFENGKLAVEGALGLDPDVVVLDISMPVMNGFQASALLRDLKCRTKIVMLTTYEDSEFISKAFSCGADAYVCKRSLAADLGAAISAVLHGNTFTSPSIGPLEAQGDRTVALPDRRIKVQDA
jgi:DNA-binding NarL/FixJ family response regulator